MKKLIKKFSAVKKKNHTKHYKTKTRTEQLQNTYTQRKRKLYGKSQQETGRRKKKGKKDEKRKDCKRGEVRERKRGRSQLSTVNTSDGRERERGEVGVGGEGKGRVGKRGEKRGREGID